MKRQTIVLLVGWFLCVNCGCFSPNVGKPKSKQPSITAKSETQELFDAIHQDNLPKLERILKSGTNPNVFDPGEPTPIHAAIHFERAKMVKLLLRFGADVNFELRSVDSPLFYASAGTSSRIVEILLRHGARVNSRSKDDGMTPLMAAAVGSTIGWQFTGGRTKQEENLRIAKLLLQWGAEINSTDFNGRTALDMAQETASTVPEHKAMVELLLSNGASSGQNPRTDPPIRQEASPTE